MSEFTLERPLPFATDAFWQKVGKALGATKVTTWVGPVKDYRGKQYFYIEFRAHIEGQNTSVRFRHAHAHFTMGRAPKKVPPQGRNRDGRITVERGKHSAEADKRTRAKTPAEMVKEIKALVSKARGEKKKTDSAAAARKERRSDAMSAAVKDTQSLSPSQLRAKMRKGGVRFIDITDLKDGRVVRVKRALSKADDDDVRLEYIRWKMSQTENTMGKLHTLLEGLKGGRKKLKFKTKKTPSGAEVSVLLPGEKNKWQKVGTVKKIKSKYQATTGDKVIDRGMPLFDSLSDAVDAIQGAELADYYAVPY